VTIKEQERDNEMAHYHAVIWLDHSEAHVFHFTPDEVERLTAHSSNPRAHQHHKRGSTGSSDEKEDHAYFEHVTGLLKGAQEILVVGPAKAKLDLIKHIHKHHQDMVPKIAGVETLDHPTDGQLIAYARKYFHAKDRMI
jgi:stalled ribosome rescue protein Dom34